jgi:histidinol-phosphatase (PHP family)
MQQSCARALELGLRGIAFTEHVDHTIRTVPRDLIAGDQAFSSVTVAEELLAPPSFDASGYLASIEECRGRFPDLRIMSGLEVGEPHWHAEATRKVLGTGQFDRILGSLHCLPDAGGFAEPSYLYGHRDPYEVVRTYLSEVVRLVAQDNTFSVLAHIDYPVRDWPQQLAGPFDPSTFEEEFRLALHATAASGRALEINTVVPLHSIVLHWWHEEGGDAVTFASDAHEPSAVARGFRSAADMAEAHGFRSGQDPYAFWGRAT